MRLCTVDIGSGSNPSSVGTTGYATTSPVQLPVGTTVPDHRVTPGATTHPPRAEAGAAFESVRSRLFGIAYRMLGRAADAEDVVQDVWVCWLGADRATVRDPVAFLVTITRRVAINAATSARARREVSAGGWLPEHACASVDPALEAERSDTLEFVIRLLMERLSPIERAVYVLREAFEYPFREIAEVLGLSEANARQLAYRARKHLAEQRHHPVDHAERDGLREAFLHASRAGDMVRLERALAEGSARVPTVAVRPTARSAHLVHDGG